jgi:hypothetical protein
LEADRAVIPGIDCDILPELGDVEDEDEGEGEVCWDVDTEDEPETIAASSAPELFDFDEPHTTVQDEAST